MPTVDLCFPVLGQTLPTDHAYALYSALSDRLPVLHAEDAPVGIASVNGTYTSNGTLQLDRRSHLRLRLPAERIAEVLPLAGQALLIAGHSVRLGVPRVRALVPAAGLIARIVTIKGFEEPSPFLEAARRQLESLEIRGRPDIPLLDRGPRQGQPCRRVLRIKTKTVVGFALQVTELSADESIRLQEQGIGGRRKMGCGFFVPTREEGAL
jgi:CRISPR-associated protein Cas6